MAKFMLLIYGNEQEWDAMTAEEIQRRDDGHVAFVEAAGSAVLDSHPLELAETATTLHSNPAGRATPTDGPFLETKEALGGYYVVEASDLDQAIAMARRLPELKMPHCAVEVRPVRDVG
ncbi:YciI family protein [Micromonospora sp. NPDC000316]|uniref:YciI family protein n=1 Tax=Micromonospora sp. NPDC000316 TaxID=3364216 RepID=UPI0036B4DA34